MNMKLKSGVPSLLDLCIRTAIDNVSYLGDVGETDIDLLGHILRHCNAEQLMHVEKCTEGRDLSPVTDTLWKKFYEMQYGARSTNLVVEKMKQKKVSVKWRLLYEAKLKNVKEDQQRFNDQICQLFKKDDDDDDEDEDEDPRLGPLLSHMFWGMLREAKVGDLRNWHVENKNSIANICRIRNYFSFGNEEVPSSSTEIATVSEALAMPLNTTMWVKGSMKVTNEERNFYYYRACSKCDKSTSTQEGDIFTCNNCRSLDSVSTKRCITQVEVFDSTGKITAYLYGKEAEDLLLCIAKEMAGWKSTDDLCINIDDLRIDINRGLLRFEDMWLWLKLAPSFVKNTAKSALKNNYLFKIHACQQHYKGVPPLKKYNILHVEVASATEEEASNSEAPKKREEKLELPEQEDHLGEEPKTDLLLQEESLGIPFHNPQQDNSSTVAASSYADPL